MTVDQFLDRLFNKFDENKDGHLSWFEFVDAIKFLTMVTGTTFPKRYDMEDIFSRIDHDGDTTVSKE